MEALLTPFIAAFLAEWGDKTQLLAAALAARTGRPGAVLGGVAVGALANSTLAAFGGSLLHDHLTVRASSLLVALAVLLAGASGFMRGKTPDMGAGWKVGAFLTSAACFFLLEFGDKTQFVTFALATQFESLWLAAAGATGGVLLASLPAVMLGNRLATTVPLRPIRIGIATLFLLAGFLIAVNALRLA